MLEGGVPLTCLGEGEPQLRSTKKPKMSDSPEMVPEEMEVCNSVKRKESTERRRQRLGPSKPNEGKRGPGGACLLYERG